MCPLEDEQPRPADPVTVYRITVRGHLDASWGERLAGMKVMPVENDGPGPERTVLLGPVRDQAALTGVLNALHGLRLTLLGVEALDEEPLRREGEKR